jgi:hypothetical protein
MLTAMNTYSLPTPNIPETVFSIREETVLGVTEHLHLADSAMASVVDSLIARARDLVQEAHIQHGSPSEVRRIRQVFELIVPAADCKSLADILNAGWEAFQDPDLWTKAQHRHVKGRQHEVLKELLLKNIQLFDVEQMPIEKSGGDSKS